MINPPAFLLLGLWVSIGLHYKCCEVWALLSRWLITGLNPAWPGSDRCPPLRLSFRTLHWRCGTRHDSPFALEKASGGRFKCKCLQHLTSGEQRAIYWGPKSETTFNYFSINKLPCWNVSIFNEFWNILVFVLSLFCYELHKLNMMIMFSSMTLCFNKCKNI